MNLAFSIGDLNGINPQLLLKAHNKLIKLCSPFYFIHLSLLEQAASLLGEDLSKYKGLCLVEFEYSLKTLDFKNPSSCLLAKKPHKKYPNIKLYKAIVDVNFKKDFKITPGLCDAFSGEYSFASFKAATYCTSSKDLAALITLAINKKAWDKAGIKFLGHTAALSFWLDKRAIMMLGCKQLYTALYTEHIPLAKVASSLNLADFSQFLYDFAKSTGFKNIGVLGLNPHAGDDGVIGDEELIIKDSIYLANYALAKGIPAMKLIKKELDKSIKKEKNALNPSLDKKTNLSRYLRLNELVKLEKAIHSSSFEAVYCEQILVPDSAFSKFSLLRFKVLVGLYHDQVLPALKALYFKESINVSLNLNIIRTSVDHGTAFDKAYKGLVLSDTSLINAVKAAKLFKEKISE